MRLTLYLDGPQANSVRPASEVCAGYHRAGSVSLRIGARMFDVELRSIRNGGHVTPSPEGIEALFAWAQTHGPEVA